MPAFVGRVESMRGDWARLCAVTGVRESIGHLQRSAHRPYTEYYDAPLRKLGGDRYRSDIEHFGYDFGR